MSGSLLVSAVGAVLAAIGSGVVLTRCFRGARGDLIAWSAAILGLFISLGAQAAGHLKGFDPALFRAMEIGGQVIAPLAVLLALSEVAAKSMAARFCARLYIPALAIVATVVLGLDQLASAKFTKAWPDPSAYYEPVAKYVMYAVGATTALVAVIAFIVVLARYGRPGWKDALPAQLVGGAAGVFLSYPALAQLAGYEGLAKLPVSSEFPVLTTAAAGLVWLAATQTAQLRLAVLHGSGRDPRDRAEQSLDRARRFDDADQTGDFEPATGDFDGFDGRDGRGRPRGYADRDDYARRQPYRDDPDDGWREDRGGDGRYGRPDSAFVATGDIDRNYGGGWRPSNGSGDRREHLDDVEEMRPGYAGRHSARGAGISGPEKYADGAGLPSDDGRSRLFGQIAIYTLLEDRVAEFDQLIERLVAEVRSREPDTLVYIVHAVPSAPMQRILYEVYRERAAYAWHGRQPYVMQFEADRRPYVLATNVIELGLQQAKVSPFPSVTEFLGEPGYDTSGFERPDYLRDYVREPANGRRGGPRERR